MTPAVRAPATRWIWLAAALLAVVATGLVNAGLNMALPAIAADLHATTTFLSWMIGGTVLAFAVLVVPAAFAGDALGHARVQAFGAAVFTASSVLAALAGAPWVMLVARIGQGAGAALVVPQAVGYARAHLPRLGQAVAFGLFALAYVGGPPLGTVLARVLLGPLDLTWRAVFWVAVPLGLLSLAGAAPVLAQAVRLRFEPLAFAAAVLAALGALGIAYPLVFGNVPHLAARHVAQLVAGVAALGGALALDVTRRGFRLGAGAPLLLLLTVAGAAQLTAVTLVEQVVARASATSIAVLAGGMALGAIGGGLLAVPLVLSVDSRTVVALGCVLSGLGAVGNLLLARQSHLVLVAFAVCLVASGAGYALALAGLLRGDATGPGPVFAMLPLGAIGAAALLTVLVDRTPGFTTETTLRDIGGFLLVASITALAVAAVLARWLAPPGPAAAGGPVD